VADRVSIPPRLRIFARQFPAIHEYLSKTAIGLIDDKHGGGCLNDLPRFGMSVELHETHRQTMRIGVVLAVIRLAFIDELLGPWLIGQASLNSLAGVCK
jgi:hypothetical protein